MDKYVEVVLLSILIILVVALFAISFLRRRKFTASLKAMREEIKVGDKVMTDCGMVGEVANSYVEEETKYFVLKTGKDDQIGYITVHGASICYVFGKEDAQSSDKKVYVIKPQDSNNQ